MTLVPDPPRHPEPPVLPEVPEGVTPAPRDTAPAWHPLVAFSAFIAAFLAAGVFGSIVLVASGDTDDPPAWANIAATLLQDVALIGAALGFAALAARPRAWHFGLRPVRRLRAAVGWTVLAYVAFIAFSALFLTAVGADQTDDLPQDLGVDESTAAAIGIGVLVCVGAPLVEEFFFRGYLYGAFRRWRGPWVGAILVGVLFGAVHAGGSDAAYLVPLAALGVGFCLLYERTGSLYPPIVLHAVNNSVAFSVSMDFSWQVPLVMVGSLAVIAAILALVRQATGPAPRPA
ncbi:MAG TPA: CPBP family intramembrane glutamic endopeptidase [Baekduia sp.]|nr:CPBP family intramembrane glutamic endopeptidase [Baekduia sp.]